MQQIHGNLDALASEEQIDEKNVTERFFGLAGAAVSSYCGDKEHFLGKYQNYGNPQGISSGSLGNVLSYNENSCGALSCIVTLAPEETTTVAFLLGEKYSQEAENIIANYTNAETTVKRELTELKSHWQEKLERLKVNTPSPEFNTMINTWNAYNCFMTFLWSRAASFIYCGLRNGYGYRDTVQDIQGIIHLAPEEAAEKIRFMLSAQTSSGGGLPGGSKKIGRPASDDRKRCQFPYLHKGSPLPEI